MKKNEPLKRDDYCSPEQRAAIERFKEFFIRYWFETIRDIEARQFDGREFGAKEEAELASLRDLAERFQWVDPAASTRKLQ